MHSARIGSIIIKFILRNQVSFNRSIKHDAIAKQYIIEYVEYGSDIYCWRHTNIIFVDVYVRFASNSIHTSDEMCEVDRFIHEPSVDHIEIDHTSSLRLIELILIKQLILVFISIFVHSDIAQ